LKLIRVVNSLTDEIPGTFAGVSPQARDLSERVRLDSPSGPTSKVELYVTDHGDDIMLTRSRVDNGRSMLASNVSEEADRKSHIDRSP